MKFALLPSPQWFRARLYHILSPLLALAAVALLQQTTFPELLEDVTINLRFQARAPFDPPADQRLVLLGVDQKALDTFGAWPWPRNVEADIIKTMVQANQIPHTLTFDFLFTEKSNKANSSQAPPGPTNDQSLADAVGLLPSVVTGALKMTDDSSLDSKEKLAAEADTRLALQNPGYTSPLTTVKGDVRQILGSNIAIFPFPELRKQSFFGFVNDEPSSLDHIRHKIPLIVRVDDQVYPSLALQTLCQMLDVDPDKVEIDLPQRLVRLRNLSHKTWTIPINAQGEFFINYRRQDSFTEISISKFVTACLDRSQNGTPVPPDGDLRNKTVLVGQTETGLTDLGPTPLQAQSPLAFTHLNVMNNVLKNDYLRFVPWQEVVVGWLIVTWLSLLRLKDAPVAEAVVLFVAMMLIYVLFAFAIFWKWSLLVDLAWPVLSYGFLNFGGVVLRWREEQMGREQIKKLFSRMVSPEIMNHLLEQPENMKLGGSERAVTILFSDIRDYTKFSEGLKATEVVRQLNIYFESMVGCVKEARGTFHKYIGDAIMAAWGDIAVVSLGRETDARNCVRSALEMRRKLRILNEGRQQEGLIPLRIGIGINHGSGVLVGMIGASDQMEFTVMGDAVNVASRLEALTKEFHTDIAISESVRLLLGEEFLIRRLGLIVVKGKSEPTVVYEVLSEKNDPASSKMTPESVATYETAFDHFLARRFAEAEAGFAACDKSCPGDYCIREYLKASRECSAQPPPPDWDGRIVMKSK